MTQVEGRVTTWSSAAEICKLKVLKLKVQNLLWNKWNMERNFKNPDLASDNSACAHWVLAPLCAVGP